MKEVEMTDENFFRLSDSQDSDSESGEDSCQSDATDDSIRAESQVIDIGLEADSQIEILSDGGLDASVRTSVDKNGNPKKRVQFMDDDQLVRILEIPPREESPLLEELEPCDPNKLAVDLDDVHIDDIIAKRPKRCVSAPGYRRPLHRDRTPSLVARISAMAAGKSSPGKAKISGAKDSKDKGRTTKLSPAAVRLYGANLRESYPSGKPLGTKPPPSRSDTCRRRTLSASTQSFGQNRPHSSSCSQSSLYQNANQRNTNTFNYYGNRGSLNRNTSPTRNIFNPPATNGRAASCKSANLETMRARNIGQRISLDTSNLKLGTTLPVDSNGYSQTTPRMHPSPYRQGSATSMTPSHQMNFRSLGSHSTPSFSQYAREERVGSAGQQSSSPGIARLQLTPGQGGNVKGLPVSPRKVFAWQMANSQLPNMETPCIITPMWENTPKPYAYDSFGTT